MGEWSFFIDKRVKTIEVWASGSILLKSAALWAQTLEHVVDAMNHEIAGQCHHRCGNAAQAEGALASLAVEVGVLVVILDMAVVAVAQFVAYAVAAILNDVYQVMFSEQRKCPEDA